MNKKDKSKVFDSKNPKKGNKGQGDKKGTVNPVPGKGKKKA